MQTTIVKWGNSQGIRLPKYLLESAHFSERDVVEISVVGEKIVIKKINVTMPHKTIQDRFKGYQDAYEPININWGEPEGNEIW
ncbi:MAG: AbrB/MazE/SpoVT family DNA-binding domain-containing protein [Eubacteriaceae bacterium]|nr:AbrB/MazE/SpoVT family DNA-binding domain-containing protein [Eubacteriaceae bacterium]